MRDESPPILVQKVLPNGAKESNILVFYEDVKQTGYAVGQFNTVLMVRVGVPGDPSSVEHWVEETYPEGHPHPQFGKSRVNQAMMDRFGDQVRAYKASNEALIGAGTPLEALPFINRAQVHMLRFHGIHTAEALSGLHDEQLSRIGIGARDLVNKANAYLKSASDSQAALKVDAEKRALEDRLANLEGQWTELNAALADLPEDAKAMLKATLKKNQDNAGSKRKAA